MSAVMIEGARRVGKSTVAEEFAKEEYDDYILIDFSTAEQAIKDNFENIGNMDMFFRNLFVLTGKTLEKRNGVIIFDEVQFFPKARQSIKQLVKDGRFDYIETGSLISIQKNVKDILIPSEEENIKMYPMDFEEFLWAVGNNVIVDTCRDAFEKNDRYIIYTKDLAFEDGVLFMPIYMTMFLQSESSGKRSKLLYCGK